MAGELRPYWQSADGLIKVYHAPCEAVIAAGLVPVDEVSLIHDDPPYGIGNNNLDRSGGKRRVGRFRKFAPMEGNAGPFDPALILALGRPTVFWGANHYADKLPPSPAWILWDKRCETPPDDGSDGELAWCSPGGPWGGTVRIFRHLWRGLCRASEKNGRTGPGHAGAHLHPTQKPKALVSFVFQRAKLRRGDLVFVPHAGSLPEGPVCQAMGLRLIACEVSREHCDTAISRLGAITADRAAEPCGPLFAAVEEAGAQVTGPPVTIPDLLRSAAVLLAAAHRARTGAREQADERDAPQQRAALSAACAGLVPLAELQAVPADAITTAGRLLAWTAAVRTVRILGSRTRPAAVWRSIGSASLDLPRDADIGLREEAADELDQAARIRPRRQAVVELCKGVDARARRTRAELLPVLEALEVGAPELDTGERLRRALAAWEGRL